MLERQGYRFAPEAQAVMARYIDMRRRQPHFANARSIRNALDRARLRQANRLFESGNEALTADDLSRIEACDIAASRVLAGAAPQTEKDTE